MTSENADAAFAHPLLALFCSRRCPGPLVVRAYDLAVALRDGGVPTVGGFHTSLEQEMLAFLPRGTQPVVACPARDVLANTGLFALGSASIAPEGTVAAWRALVSEAARPGPSGPG